MALWGSKYFSRRPKACPPEHERAAGDTPRLPHVWAAFSPAVAPVGCASLPRRPPGTAADRSLAWASSRPRSLCRAGSYVGAGALDPTLWILSARQAMPAALCSAPGAGNCSTPAGDTGEDSVSLRTLSAHCLQNPGEAHPQTSMSLGTWAEDPPAFSAASVILRFPGPQ